MGFIKRLLGASPNHDRPAESMDAEDPVGWLAIDNHLEAFYPGVEPMHWGTIVGWRLGGPDPLDGISAYANDGPPLHWHYISYGSSELYTKESDDPDRSGWGLELTFRLARTAGAEDAPPIWAVNFLQNLARYIEESGKVLWPGHHMNANGPIAAEIDTLIEAAVFIEDPELGAIDTPHGRVRFVQVVGITLDEYELIRRWNTDSVVELLGRGNPLHVTDLERRSVLDDPVIAAEGEGGRRADGSSMGGVYVDRLEWVDSGDRLHIVISALAIEDVRTMLEGRLPFGREGFLEGQSGRLDLVPGSQFGWHPHDGGIALTLTPEATRTLAELPPTPGEYRWAELSGLTVEVEPGEG
jgi:suppressor of fused-like protein